MRHIHFRWLLTFLFLSILWTIPKHAVADDEEIEDMDIQQLSNLRVSGVSRFEQPLSDAPATVTVVTAEQIKRQGYRNLAEIFRSVRGFMVTGNRVYTFVGVRGFGRTGDYNSRILILVDGHRMNENIYESVSIGNDSILDLDLVDRIEFIRGPSSAVYGDNAFFGVVNILTRKGKSIDGAEVSASAGSLETYTGRVTYGNQFKNGLEMVLSGSLLDSAGQRSFYLPEFDTPATNNGIARNLDGERNYRLFSRFALGDFTLEGAFVERRKDVPTAIFDSQFNQRPTFVVDRRGFVDLSYNHTYGGTLAVKGRLFYDHFSYYEKLTYTSDGDPASIINQDSAYNHWIGGELQGTYPIFTSNLLLAGAEFQKNLQQKLRNHDLDPEFTHLEIDKRSEKWGVYLQDEQTLLTNLILNAGVRLDHFSTFGTTANPRAALIYKPFNGTTCKFLYGEAFRAPNFFELNYDIPIDGFKGNSNLKPEKIRSYELVLEQGLGTNYRLTVTGFINQIRDLIIQETDQDGMRVFVNRDSAEAKGADVELEGKLENGLQGRISYSYQDVTDGNSGAWMENSPHHMAAGSLIVPLWRENLSLGCELQYVGRRLGRNRVPVGSYILANLTLFSRKLLPGLELSGSIYNLFDKSYGDPATDDHLATIQTIPQDGRTFRVKLTWAF